MTDRKLLLAAMMGLATRVSILDKFGKAQTSAAPKRYKHPSEVEEEKKRAQRREIAEWNARWEAQKK